MRSVLLSLLLGAGVVRSAINPDGTQAVEPVTDEDDSPIADLNTYYPDQHDCPLECKDVTNTHSWITYFSVDRLRRCNESMLLQFSTSKPLDDPDTTILIRSCSLGAINTTAAAIHKDLPTIENPKKDDNLFLSSLDSAPACSSEGTETQDQIRLSMSSSRGNVSTENAGDIDGVLDGMRKYFSAKDNCDESFIYVYHQQTVGAVYVGDAIGKGTVDSALQALKQRVSPKGALASLTVAELCGEGRSGERSFGVAIDTTGNLAGIQKLAQGWSEGKCSASASGRAETLTGVTVREISTANNGTNSTNSTVNSHASTALPLKRGHTFHGRHTGHIHHHKRAGPQPSADGTCATHLIADGDTCDKLSKVYGVSISDLEKWNKGKTWAWTECKEALVGYNMCVSDGSAPLPPPQQGAECGPLVPGTKKPTDKSVNLATLNPCPLKACCSNWGFCGVFPAHCDIHAPEGGGPGTKLKDFQNTCVANCGNEIKQNSGPPAKFQRIGYYESYNWGRECLHMKAKNANTDGSYTHMHWAFADIDPNTWKPVINDSAKQWEDFKKLPNMKRIVSLGGWAASTEPATYNIIRQAIINNRDTFAANLAKFVQDEGIDGVDIDWEYPGAPDIMVGGSPIGKTTDGLDYLKFLIVLKKALGQNKSVSIAAPASYWYLKAFPIDRIAAVIDYIVYMTYDLHGQWDYGNPNAYDMCPSGKCIRSHGKWYILAFCYFHADTYCH
jgi:hypothetical protein